MADTYHITNQKQSTALAPGGSFQDVMNVTFETASGTVGTVKIPLTQYSADAVKAAVEARVSEIDKVNAL